MAPLKTKTSTFLRRIGLIHLADLLRYRLEKARHQKANNAFRKQHPNIVLPPDYLIYESHSISYSDYYYNGIKNANELITYFKAHQTLTKPVVLDWGCGPGRIIRHMPKLLDDGSRFFATDYNQKSIDWCKHHLKGIEFNRNQLDAQLPYADDFFDVIYGLSIFTHLSEPMHKSWYDELYRVLKPGGLMLLTTQGGIYRSKLTSSELEQFDRGELVVRGQVIEGHRLFSAFQPPIYMKKLFHDVKILDHIERPQETDWWPQDIWIVRK